MELLNIMLKRRSVRAYTKETVKENDLKRILQAGLLSPTGRNKKPWEFIVVKEREVLEKLSVCRTGGAGMLKDAAAAIVVIGDEGQTDVWTEDCSIAMSNMHLMASALGVGSCWIQGRLRKASEEVMTEDYIRDLLGFPSHMRLEAILSLGMPKEEPVPHSIEEIDETKIHWEKY